MKTNLSFCLMTTVLLCEEFNPETFCGAADSFKSPSKNAVEAAKQEMATEREQLAKDEAKRQLIIDEYSQSRTAIEARYKRKTGELEVKYLKLQTEENRAYAAGDKDTEEHRKKLMSLREQKEKEASELCEQRRSEIRNLNKAYPKGESYCNALPDYTGNINYLH